MLTVIKHKFRSLQWKFLLLLASGYMASFLSIQGIQALMPFLRADFGITRTQAGLYSTFLFSSATIIAIFSGNIVDKIGSRPGLLIGIFSLGGLMVLHGLAPVYGILLMLALFAGLGFSVITPAVNKALMLKVKPERRAISMGIMHSGSGIGGFTGATLLPILAGSIGWRLAIIASGITALGLGFIVSRNLALKNGRTSESKDSASNNFKKQFSNIIKNEQLMLACSLGLVFGLAVGAIPAHYTLYLTLDLNYPEAIAGFSLGLVQLGGIVGRILWGWVSDVPLAGDRKNSFLIIMIVIVLLKLLNAFAGSLLAGSIWLMFIISFLLGVSALGWSGLFFTVVSERASPEQTGIASGMSLIFLRLGVVIGPPVFGFLGDYFDHYHNSWLVLALVVMTSGLMYYIMQSRIDQKTTVK